MGSAKSFRPQQNITLSAQGKLFCKKHNEIFKYRQKLLDESCFLPYCKKYNFLKVVYLEPDLWVSHLLNLSPLRALIFCEDDKSCPCHSSIIFKPSLEV